MNEKDEQTANASLDEMVEASNDVLFKISTVFPFTLFPDVIEVDRNKVNIIHRHFFFSKTAFQIYIHDLRTVKIDTGPFFAQMRFELQGYEQNPEPLKFLPKEPAAKMHRIIMGLIGARERDIGLDNLDSKNVEKKVERIGATEEKVTGA